MRFLKKAGISELEQFMDTFKDFELFLTAEDITDGNMNDGLEKIESLIKKEDICISAVHCPKHRENINYLSVCEIAADELSQKIFKTVCDFAKRISEKEKYRPITVIVHEGCDRLCELQENDSVVCEKQQLYNEFCNLCEDINKRKAADISPESGGSEGAENSDEKKKEGVIQIGIEVIPPYTPDNKRIVQPMCRQKIVRSKHKTDSPKIGRVIDFCHILAEKYLTQNTADFKEYLSDYMNQFEDAPILLFHLSNFGKEAGTHGEVFHDNQEDNEVFEAIFEYCMENENLREVPITLEVSGSSSQETAGRFNAVMLRWSKLHILPKFKNLVGKDMELYECFDNLYRAFTARTETEADMGELFVVADKIRSYILQNYKSEENRDNTTYPLSFSKDRQDLDIHRFQIQAYIYYIKYINAALYLIDYYKSMALLESFEFSIMLKNYMFHDTVEELKFEGLVGYFNIPWLMKKEVTLYHFYDRYEGDMASHGTFKEELANCMKHIVNPGEPTEEVISFGKAFGRCALKYYTPERDEVYKYNIRIAKVPVNCFYDGSRWIPLQAVKRTGKFIEEEGKQNYIIDFSEFYFGRGDAVKAEEGSFKHLYLQVIGEKFTSEVVGSIYDQEVIIKNASGIRWQNYYLDINDMLILLIFYKYLLNHREKVDSIICDRNGVIYRILEQINFEQEREDFRPDTKHKSFCKLPYSDKNELLNEVYNRLDDSIKNYDEAQNWLKENGFGG